MTSLYAPILEDRKNLHLLSRVQRSAFNMSSTTSFVEVARDDDKYQPDSSFREIVRRRETIRHRKSVPLPRTDPTESESEAAYPEERRPTPKTIPKYPADRLSIKKSYRYTEDTVKY